MKAARYRIVHYVPDPFLGARIPVAAMLYSANGLSILRAPHVPGADCLGGNARAASVELLLESLADVTSFDRLPISVGPQARLSDAHEVPSGVEPRRWLEGFLAGEPSRKPAARGQQAPRRATFGYRFLETWGVARWVRKTFHPGHDLKGFLPEARPLGPISHYVPGTQEVLLLEPLAPSRAQAEADVEHVASLFGAYRTAIADGGHQNAKLLAYLLKGGSEERRAAMKAALRPFAHEVIDTSAEAERDKFLRRIQRVGESVVGPTLA